MSCKEIITFQLGDYANYVAAHWWNIQESYFQYDKKTPSEINHDVLFREGRTYKGHTTFTPRTILVDKTENLVNAPVLPVSRAVSQKDISNLSLISYSGTEVTTQKHEFIRDLERAEKGQKVNFTQKDYNFNDTVKSWSDFLRTRYHPKSVCSFQNSISTGVFHSGKDIYTSIEDEVMESIRSYMEECNNLQGFQVLVDATDAFGGLASRILLHLQDEYPSKTIFTVPTLASHYEDSIPTDHIRRIINVMLSYQNLTENSSLLVPLGMNRTFWKELGSATVFPHLAYQPRSHYQTSAILASFLDTATLKYRLREERDCMYDLVSGLNYYNKKVCAATITLPFPMAPHSNLLDTLENLDDSQPLWNQLTPGCNVMEDTIFYQRITVRGIPHSKLKNPAVGSTTNSRAYNCTSVAELVHLYLSYRLSTISDVISTPLPLKTAIPYPKIFSPHVSPAGAVDGDSTRMKNHEVESCPAITGLHCCKAVGNMLDSLHQTVKTINIKRFPEFLGDHMDQDEFDECLEKLLAMGYGLSSNIELR